jgi:hypothetical protein
MKSIAMRVEASIGRCEEALRVCGCDNNNIPPTRSQDAVASKSGRFAGKPSEERTGQQAKISLS